MMSVSSLRLQFDQSGRLLRRFCGRVIDMPQPMIATGRPPCSARCGTLPTARLRSRERRIGTGICDPQGAPMQAATGVFQCYSCRGTRRFRCTPPMQSSEEIEGEQDRHIGLATEAPQLRGGAGVIAAARVRPTLRCFPPVSIHPLTRGTAQRSANSILEGRVRKRFWLGRRISPPLSDFAPF
jgi:hypothetical protein